MIIQSQILYLFHPNTLIKTSISPWPREHLLIRLSNHLQNRTLLVPNNRLPIRPVHRYRPNKSPTVLLKLLQRILGISSALHNLRNRICRTARFAARTRIPCSVLQDVAQLVCCWRGGGDFELELASADWG